MNGYECDGMDIFMRWKIECSIQRGGGKLIEHSIFHRMKISVPSDEWKTFIFVLYNIKNICCHLERFSNLNML